MFQTSYGSYLSWSRYCAFWIWSCVPVMLMMRSVAPGCSSSMVIVASDSARICLILIPPFPMIAPANWWSQHMANKHLQTPVLSLVATHSPQNNYFHTYCLFLTSTEDMPLGTDISNISTFSMHIQQIHYHRQSTIHFVHFLKTRTTLIQCQHNMWSFKKWILKDMNVSM